MGMKGLRNGIFAQGFAPNRIETATTLTTTDVLAIRISASTSYTINGAGTTATMPAGITVINEGVTSIVFSGSTVVEVMDA